MTGYFTLLLTCFINFAICRDFYVGMFKKNDILVAQDRLYKERHPFRMVYAKYGRYFKCPITYFRVVDRLGMGKGPRVQITRGGLRKNYIVLKLTSSYNLPISVNIYVGCENKMTTIRATTTTTQAPVDHTTTDGDVTGNITGSHDNSTTVTGGDVNGNASVTNGDSTPTGQTEPSAEPESSPEPVASSPVT